MRPYVVVLSVWVLGACPGGSAGRSAEPAPDADGILPTSFGPSVDREIARVRVATAAFRDLDRAVAAGYPATAPGCLDHPPYGAMGYHHQQASLLDARIEVERPEILVYEKTPEGKYQLNGVEYVVPLSAWTGRRAPTVFGQSLKRAPSLGIWYLHVWIWKPNPSGLFADWNPAVRC